MKKIQEFDEFRYINARLPMWLYKPFAAIAIVENRRIGDMAVHAIAQYVQSKSRQTDSKKPKRKS